MANKWVIVELFATATARHKYAAERYGSIGEVTVMNRRKLALFGATTVAAFASQSNAAEQPNSPAAAQPSVAEIIVTAQKREQNIQNVGVSIQAASGDKLIRLGITDTSQLQKIVPGFVATPTVLGTVVFTIRGVGFQDNTLAGAPTVSVYQDESPLPYAALGQGATLDLQRVEVLKGPQGTLFGENATGGAVNYIVNKPTDTFHAGGDVSVGNFSTVYAQGFVSGPIADGLDARLALQSNNSGAWQKGYGPQEGQTIGGTDFQNGRFSLLWKPGSNFRALLTLNGWLDKSYSQAAQTYRVNSPLSPTQVLDPLIINYPIAPRNDQAAGWNQCVNTDPFDPLAAQLLGVTYPTPSGTPESQGPGSAAWEGAQPTHCIPLRRDNSYYSAALRMDYDLPQGMTLTSLTSYQRFHRHAGVDPTGIPYQDFQVFQTGHIEAIYQELRLTGKFDGKGSWIVGGNYEHDDTLDTFLNSAAAGSGSPIVLGPGFVLPLGPVRPFNAQQTTTKAVYASGEFPILHNLTLIGGVRYTKEDKGSEDCLLDGGDDTLSNLLAIISGGPSAGPGGCATLGPNGQSYVAPPHLELDQSNVSWKAGVNWQVRPEVLLYFLASKGYKGGSFPTTFATVYTQLAPAVQESLLSFEAGFKSRLLHDTLTVNGAAFYYDYVDKQIQGSCPTLFGALPCLVNVPQSHVIGFELSGAWSPEFLRGLTIAPAVSYQNSRIDSSSRNQCTPGTIALLGSASAPACIPGNFYGYDQFGIFTNITGQRFPEAPEFQASIDAEYDWKLHGDLTAFVGLNASYTSSTWYSFLNLTPAPTEAYDPLSIDGYALVDLRAGVAKGPWRFQVWGRNVTNTYYWTQAVHANDPYVRFTGMPTTYGFTLSYRY